LRLAIATWTVTIHHFSSLFSSLPSGFLSYDYVLTELFAVYEEGETERAFDGDLCPLHFPSFNFIIYISLFIFVFGLSPIFDSLLLLVFFCPLFHVFEKFLFGLVR